MRSTLAADLERIARGSRHQVETREYIPTFLGGLDYISSPVTIAARSMAEAITMADELARIYGFKRVVAIEEARVPGQHRGEKS